MNRNENRLSGERRSERRQLQNEALRLGSGSELKNKGVFVPALRVERSPEVIYFILVGDSIKIGWSSAFVQSRASSHRKRRPVGVFGDDFKVLAVVHGHRGNEIEVQNYFSAHALSGEREWFSLAPELLEYIRWLRDHAFVEVGEDYESGVPPAAPLVLFENWKPDPTRRKEPTEPLWGAAYFGPRLVTGDDYYSPQWLASLSTEALGGVIDLDPYSHPIANQKIGALRIYTASDNGLKQQWFGPSERGTVWVQPPFSKWNEVAEKMLAEIDTGRVTALLALISTAALTNQYLFKALQRCDLVLVLTGRLKFWGPQVDNGNGSGPPAGHALLYFGPDSAKVAKIFAHKAVAFFRSAP